MASLASSHKYIENKPTTQTVQFGGQFIKITLLADDNKIDRSYLSRIFSGKRRPSIDFCRRLAPLLGMSVDEFINNLPPRQQDDWYAA